MDDKNDLLEQYDAEQKVERNLDFRFLLLVYMVMCVAFLVHFATHLHQKSDLLHEP